MSPRLPPQTPPPGPSDPDLDPESDLADQPITVQVDEPFIARVDPVDLVRAIAATLAAEGQPEAEVTLVVTDDEAVQALNAQYRGIEEATDVLSFPAQEDAPGFVSAPEASTYLGDIVIALPFTQRQALSLGRNMRDELRLLAVHGTLHLLGYDHVQADEEARMWARQDAILAGLEP